MLQLIKVDVLRQVNQPLMEIQHILLMMWFTIVLLTCLVGFQELLHLALNNATLPYLVKLANNGYQKALSEDKNFLAGLNVHKGMVTYKAVADVFGHNYVSPEEAIIN
jgi:hypothetical protein